MHVHMYAHIATHMHMGLDIFDCQTLDTSSKWGSFFAIFRG